MVATASAVSVQLPVAASGSPDFSIVFSAGPTFNPGASGRFTAYVVPSNGETATVTVIPGYATAAGGALSAVGVVTASPPEAQFTAQTYSQTQTFTLSANANAVVTPGTFSETIEAFDTNGNTHSYTLTFTITGAAADFTLSPSTPTVTVAQGTSGNVTVTIGAQQGFNADVDLTVRPNGDGPSAVPPYAVWPQGMPVAGTPVDDVPGPYPGQMLTVNVSAQTAPGTYTLTVTGASSNSAAAAHSFLLTVVVVSNPSIPSYTLALSSCPTFNPGASTSFTATITPLNGENMPITLTPTQGAMQVTPPTDAVLGQPYPPQTFTVSQSAKVGSTTQTVTVEAVDTNGITYAVSTTCASSTTPADFTLTPAQTTLTIAQGASLTDAIIINAVNKLSSDIQMTAVPTTAPSTTGVEPIGTWASSGAPVTNVKANYPQQQLTVAVSSEVAVGTYTMRVDATSYNAASTEQTVTLTVNVVPGSGDYTISTAATGPTLAAGGTGTLSVTITPLGNESVPITLVPSQGPGTVTPQPGPGTVVGQAVILQPPFTSGQAITQLFTVAVNAHVPTGPYHEIVAAIDAHGFAQTASTNYTVTSPPADYTLTNTTASTSPVYIAQMNTGTVTVRIQPVNQMWDTIKLSVAPGSDNTNPLAPQGTWSNGTPTIDATSSGGMYPNQFLTFAPSANTPTGGPYHYVVTGTSANSAQVTHSTDVYVVVTSGAPDFTVSLTQNVSFHPGGASGTIYASVASVNADNETVALTPDQGQVTASPATQMVPVGGSTWFQLTAPAQVTPGQQTFTVTAVGTQTHQAHRFSVPYTLLAPASFTLSATPQQIAVSPGGAGSTSVAIITGNGISSDVQLTVLPTSDTLAQHQTVPVPTWSTTHTPVVNVSQSGGSYTPPLLTFTDPPTDRGGTYSYTLMGTSANASPTQWSLLLTVTVAWPSFTLSATAVPAINPGTSQSFTVTASPVNGDTSTVTLVPQQGIATATPSMASVSASYGSAQFSMAVGANTPAGTYMELVTGIDQLGNTYQLSVAYTVTGYPATFSLTANPSNTASAHPGGQTTLSVAVAPANGFSSDVALVVTPAPDTAGPTRPIATWSNGTQLNGTPVVDAPSSSSQTLNFTVPQNALAGTYHYQVAGRSAGAPLLFCPCNQLDVYVQVVPPVANGFTLQPAAGPTIDPGSSGTLTVAVVPGPTETTPVTVYAMVAPGTTNPTSVTVNPPYSSPATFTLALPAATPAGSYTAAFVAVDGNQNNAGTTTTYTVSSTPASFAIRMSASPVTALAGESNPATTVAILGPSHGFNSTVTWSVVPAADTKPGVQPTVTFAAGGQAVIANVQPTNQTINVLASSSVTAGTYHFTVTGMSSNAVPPVTAADLYISVPSPGGSPGAPAISSISPTSGPLTGGTVVTVNGSGFVPNATSVLFGNIPGSNVNVASSTQLTVTSPPECAGTYDVRAVTAVGASPPVPEDQFTFTGQPTITSVSPATAGTNATTTVTITGSNLGCPNATVVSGGLTTIAAAILNDPNHPNSLNQIEVAIPPQPSGSHGDIVVITPGGSSLTVPGDGFSWQAPPPTLTTLSPSSGASTGAMSVVLTGQFLSFATSVSFGATRSPSVTVNSDMQVTAIAPAGCGTVPVTMTTAAGVSLSASFTYVAGVPSVAGLSPAAGSTAGGNSVVVTGSNLLCATSATFGSKTASSFHVDSDSQITTTAPSAAPGFVDVAVANAVGSSTTTLADQYTYEDVPAVSAVSPDAGSTTGGTRITITGQNFASGATVSVGGTLAAAVSVVSPTTIQATSPPGSGGPITIIVSDPGGSSTQNNVQFFYGPPTPTSVSPTAGPSGGGGDVRITGAGFAPDTTVFFGSQQVSATVVSPTVIDVPSAPSGTPGSTVLIALQDPAGTGSSNSVQYTFAYRPVITSIAPNNGGASGGTAVTITGSALTVNPMVFFGSVTAPSVTVNASGTLTATSPPGTAGSSVYVTVRTAGGTSAVSNNGQIFTYQPPPSGTMAPVAGPLAGGTYFVISGSNFFGSPSVTFGGVAATGVVVDSSTQVHGYSPAYASPATVSVVLTTGSGSTTVGNYSYDPIPTVNASGPVSPNAGPAQGDTGTPPYVTITGSGFLHSVTVSFGSVTVTPTSVDPSGASLVVVPPVEPRGVVQVVVNTAGGSTSTSSATQYAYGAPAVSTAAGASFAVTPPGGPLNTATQVTITGSNFVNGATVTVGGVSATSVLVVNTTTITAKVPPSATSGIQDAQVATTAGSSTLSSADQFIYGPPVLSSISPTSGPAAGGQAVTLAVTNFVNDGVQISVGGVTVLPTGYSVVGPGQATLTISTPSNATTTSQAVQITVATDSGQSGAQQYTYWAPPTVTGVSLNAGPSSGNRTVTVTGSNFVAGNVAVSFGGAAGTGISVNSSSSLTATTPAHAVGTVDVQVSFTQFSGTSAVNGADQYQFVGHGYDIVESNGAVHNMNAPNYGSAFSSQKPVSGMTFTPDGRGYWITAQDGGVFTFGDASYYGSMGGVRLNAPVYGIVATPDGHGYWLFAGDGGVFTFGNAGYYGGMGGVKLNRPVSGMAATPSGGGYWLLGQDGGVFNFGNAPNLGNWCCHTTLTEVGLAPTATPNGFWMAENDGVTASFGNACCANPNPTTSSNSVFGIAATPTGNGYWLFGIDGAVYSFGDAQFQGRPSVPNTATAAAALFAA